jgi:hypothetical protein
LSQDQFFKKKSSGNNAKKLASASINVSADVSVILGCGCEYLKDAGYALQSGLEPQAAVQHNQF